MGWEEIDNMELAAQQLSEEEVKELVRIKGVFMRTFGTVDGQECLEIIRSWTEGISTLPKQAADGHAMSLLMCLREGENNLYRRIKSLTKEGMLGNGNRKLANNPAKPGRKSRK